MTQNSIQQSASEKFETLVKKYRQNEQQIFAANEAATRLLIIDELLYLLGWKKDDFNPEQRVNKVGFTDYLLSLDGIPRLVIEAKRTGVTFKSSDKNNNQTIYEVRYLKRNFKSHFSEAIEQSFNYCRETKVPYALITNGAEWAVLQLFTPPGVSIDSTKGIYFGNIFKENFEFDLFFNLLSKTSFNDLVLEEYLSTANYQPSQVNKILQSDYSSLQWKAHSKQLYLSEFYENFFSKITDSNQRKMLDYCFVTDSKLDQYRGELKRLLKDIPPNFLPSDTEDLEPGEGKDAILNDGQIGQVVIITGSVGCGKTTLVTKCLIEARQQKGELAKTIMIDLINEVSRSEVNAVEVIYKRIFEYLEDKFPEIFELDYLRKIFHKKIKALKSGEYKEYFELNHEKLIEHEANLLSSIKKDTELFVLAVLKHLTSENISVILIFDNVDRAHEKFQEEMYALAHKISENTGTKTIITLREFTFFKNRTGGFLDVRPEDRIIHLKAPDFGKLIASRIKYIENFVDSDYRKKEWRKRFGNLEEFFDAIKKHAKAVKTSIQISSDGHNILETLSSISWHNIRYFYGLLRRVHTQLGSDDEPWSNKEVIAALMVSTELGETPVLPNIFVPSPSSNQAYFLKLRLVSYLSILKSSEVIGGVPVKRIEEFMRLYGYQTVWIRNCIEESVKQKLIECLEIPSEDDAIRNFSLNLSGTYRLSPLGLLYLSQIVKNSTYCSLIAVDLPIHSLTEFERFKAEFNEINSYMTNSSDYYIFKEGLDILLSSNLAELTRTYLKKELNKECLLSESFLKQTELQLTERKVVEAFNGTLDELASDTIKTNESNDYTPQITLDLFDQKIVGVDQHEQQKEELDHSIFIRSLDIDFDTYKYEGSEYIPLIFCALKIRSLMGVELSNGSEITRVMNENLLSDDNEKFPNNVSRALRSEKVLSQPWLVIRSDMDVKRKMFGLSEDWELHWRTVFKEK